MSQKAYPGLIVGWHPQLGPLIYHGQQGVLLAAGTRSGKGVGFVIPNLLNYPHSVVQLDVKEENFKYTSLYRQRNGQEVYLWAPFSETGHTHCWNVFDAVWQRPEHLQIGDIMSIGDALYPAKVEPRARFFNDNARSLFLGLTLYLRETPGMPVTLGEILRQSSGKGKPIKEYLKGILEARTRTDTDLPPLTWRCLDALNRFLNQPETTLGNVLSTFNAPLQIFTDPVVEAATSKSDFDLADVRKRRMTIYVGIAPGKLAEASAQLLVNLFYSQLVNVNLRELPADNPELKYQCLLLNDEFTAPGKIEIIAQANGYMAGYDLRLATVIQTVAQATEVYGEQGARTLITNHGSHLLYPPREQKDANEYSEMLGYFTAIARSKSRNRGAKSNSTGESESGQKRALMLPQELKEMGQEKLIVTLENCKPIQAEKALFYKHKVFIDRLKEVSPSIAALGEDVMPTKEQLEDAFLTRGEGSIELPQVDFQAYWNASPAQDAAQTDDSRPIEADELAILQASDIANADEILLAMRQVMPEFDEVMALVLRDTPRFDVPQVDDSRPVEPDELSFLQASDFTNEDEITEALCGAMPYFGEVMAILNTAGAIAA
ncbi:type IV secretory system conjugative DNA transfer family protein [Ralstonia chuxiongensis]|uniref:Type IV secretory system conjugative DNA transfer family protein n=1 Tax=Ralstonia chuxiongensis TaxID=2957504 RepID=A0AA41WUZ4_9RALS|nr:type IV secretory system conjugative DNA transfer family protein [Ralstonia chuxiongensis]MCP1175668.1 type IV secretory system conjugative DNA transfer family protein [Ralstonia chuxiongensis]